MFANFSDRHYGPFAEAYRQESSLTEKLLGYNFPSDSIGIVPIHWRSYPAPSKYWYYGLALIYIMLFGASVLGNGIVIWIFSTSKSLRTASNLFVINLAVFDVMMMLEIPLLIINSFHQRILGGEVGCDIYAALGSVSGIGGAIANAVIAYDRFKTISSPLDGRLSRTQAILLCGFTWLWAMPFTILPLFKIWGRFVAEGFLTTCSFDYLSDDQDTKVFVGCIFVWSYAVPMALICYFYSQLFGQVRQHEKMLKEQAKKMNVKSLVANQDAANKSVEIRIAKVAFTIFFMFVCGWTPYAFVAMTGAFGDRNVLTPVSTMIPAVCCKMVSCLDPWVYAINHPKYRQELQKRVPWLGVREPEPETVSTNTASTGSVVTAET